MIIAVDAAGGDFYPESPVKGAIEAIEERPGLSVILLGPRQLVEDELQKYDYDTQRIIVQDTPQIIDMDEAPAHAVKTKRNSSIVTGIGLLKAEKCDGFISAGNTGALLAASTFILGKLPGVTRPTIAAVYPTVKGPRLLVDAGANLELRPEMYVQFALMASVYTRVIMGIDAPKIGLLNVGEEDEKGTEELKEAFHLLQDVPNFIGNVEGSDILNGKADVYVCDGLIGNLLLKLGESVPESLKVFISKTVKDMEFGANEAELVFKILKTALREFDAEHVGGVPFLGVNGISMVGHGRSSATAIKNMILSAVMCVEYNINDEIVASLK